MNKKLKRIIFFIADCIFSLSAFSCSHNESSLEIDVSDMYIIVSEGATSCKVGEQRLLTLSIDRVSAVWSVSDNSAAMLSAITGLSTYFTTKKTGTVIVTAEINEKKVCSCSITITDNSDTNNSDYTQPTLHGNVAFTNDTIYTVTVSRDNFDGETIARIPSSETQTVNITSGKNGVVLYFTYSYYIADGQWMEIEKDSSHTYPIDYIDLENGRTLQIKIPEPKYLEFNTAFLKIYNKSDRPFTLAKESSEQKDLNGRTNIQVGDTGTYKIESGQFDGWTLNTATNKFPISAFTAENGIVYSCTLYDAEITKIIEELRLIPEYEYVVEHYMQNEDLETYHLEATDIMSDNENGYTVAIAKTYKGFAPKSFSQELIKKNTVIKIFYDRNKYTIIFKANNESDESTKQTFYYGLTQALCQNPFNAPNSDYVFAGWAESQNEGILFDDCESIVISDDKTLYAWWVYAIAAEDISGLDLTKISTECIIFVTGLITTSNLSSLTSKISNATACFSLDLSHATELIEIPSYTFSSCMHLKTVILPKALKTIGHGAFYNCADLTSIKISSSVTTIGESAFMLCENLISITISDTVTKIGKYAFYGCSKLTSVTFLDSTSTWTRNYYADGISVSNPEQNAINLTNNYRYYGNTLEKN